MPSVSHTYTPSPRTAEGTVLRKERRKTEERTVFCPAMGSDTVGLSGGLCRSVKTRKKGCVGPGLRPGQAGQRPANRGKMVAPGSSAPAGLHLDLEPTHGSRRGLYSCAASRLFLLALQQALGATPPRRLRRRTPGSWCGVPEALRAASPRRLTATKPNPETSLSNPDLNASQPIPNPGAARESSQS